MRAGKLRNQIVIQTVTESRDSLGGVSESWATYATVRASIEPLKGTEKFQDKTTLSEVDLKVRIRYLAGVTTKMRILFGTRIFNIHSIINYNEMNRELTLYCVEKVD